jgi:hypothetical protein
VGATSGTSNAGEDANRGVGVGEQGGRHPDDCGWRAPCGVGGLRGGALPSNISWALEEIEAANLRELHTPTTTRGRPEDEDSGPEGSRLQRRQRF